MKSSITYISLPVALINVDTYQRDVEDAHTKRLARGFEESALGTPVVSCREDGSFYAIDGQHRIVTVRAVKGPEAAIMCEVHYGLTREDEAHLFRLLNATRSVSTIAKFNARVEQKENTAIDIVRLLKSYNLKYSKGASQGSVVAVAALDRLYRKGPEKLDAVLDVLHGAFGRNPAAFSADMLLAVAETLDIEGANQGRLKSALRYSTPAAISAEIRSLKKHDVPLRTYIVKLYNRNLPQKGRLAA